MKALKLILLIGLIIQSCTTSDVQKSNSTKKVKQKTSVSKTVSDTSQTKKQDTSVNTTKAKQTVQCKGITKKNQQCKRMTSDSTGYCYQHIDQYPNEGKTSSSSTQQTKSTQSTAPTSTSGSYNKTIQTGPRGGQYYINKNGNKTYIKKK